VFAVLATLLHVADIPSSTRISSASFVTMTFCAKQALTKRGKHPVIIKNLFLIFLWFYAPLPEAVNFYFFFVTVQSGKTFYTVGLINE
jgi:hypothetical protein